MKYTITEFDKRRGTLMLQFDVPNVTLSVMVPIDEDGNYITGDSLKKYITEFIPTDRFKRFVDVQTIVTNEDDMFDLVGTEHEINDADVYSKAQPLFAIKEANVQRISNADLSYIKQLIDEALVEKGLV
jgi:hypothetical protein